MLPYQDLLQHSRRLPTGFAYQPNPPPLFGTIAFVDLDLIEPQEIGTLPGDATLSSMLPRKKQAVATYGEAAQAPGM